MAKFIFHGKQAKEAGLVFQSSNKIQRKASKFQTSFWRSSFGKRNWKMDKSDD